MQKKFIIYGAMLIPVLSLAQVGIKTTAPNASLHIEPTSIPAPTGMDGILIPRIKSFPVAQSKGHTVFLFQHATLPDGFYYWDGISWVSFLSNYNRLYDDSIYAVTGVGYSASGNTENNVLFSTLKAYDSTGFSVSANQITVGKSGTYLVSFNSALKKTIGTVNENRAIYTYRVKKNGVTVLTTSNSITNEGTTATSVALSGILNLVQNDVIIVTVQKTTETGSTSYVGYGTNCITMTYLND
ncbi:hypothetical protein [Chryseobacterium sediminis]|uniref:C1q domain-containing protein n=1 Tax=Chryseobacterium indologenes TaxID=253 RepID=A0A411DH77_CHRID|nr:hypothetical protein [Chryseobacterium sediminis]MDR6462667.1 hypothetical protein [Chryseobacterium sediminis]QBA19716.1 hypothetical protein EU348_00450 [Chryseobacterium indologenes]